MQQPRFYAFCYAKHVLFSIPYALPLRMFYIIKEINRALPYVFVVNTYGVTYQSGGSV